MNEPFREISCLCELDSTKLSNIDLYPPIPAPNGSGVYESLSSNCLANVDLIPLEFRQN
jgi:hypothetical protein